MKTYNKISKVQFDDEISLLKQLGQNHISFYQSNLQTIVIYNPLLLEIVRTFKDQNICDYGFRDDLKYFYTFDKELTRIYYIWQDEYQLVHSQNILPLAFQWNYILCSDIQKDEYEQEYYHDSSYSGDYSDNNWKELQLIGLNSEFRSSKFIIRDSIFDGKYFFDKFYILREEAQIPNFYRKRSYYYVMINNKRKIKYFISVFSFLESKQLKYSNYYLTINCDDNLNIFIITKQQKNCKIIRKIKSEKEDYPHTLIYNYTYVVERQKQNTQQLTNIWNLKKSYHNISLVKDSILLKNNCILICPGKQQLKIKKLY